ncbi:siderophore-interacting protein [Poseidonocella sp. HB161398]|uniref:siderophore-interacting protein n=1 Tax=Poseidonocella sp. HB161398 TaxID=2320855 RepID=UPI001107DC0D|nr:siderophore-interacting protein [Poseidonocella sp. HB161398]
MSEVLAQGELHGGLPDGLLERVAREMREHGREPQAVPGGLRLEGQGARVEMDLQGEAFRIRIAADDNMAVQRVRGAVIHMLDHAVEGLSDRMDWQGGPEPGGLPPNVIFATVEGVSRIGANFLRVRLRSDAMETFAEGGMHFRLLLPPEGRAPAWPVVDERGRTVWARGEDALHTPAYTFVDLEPGEGWMSFDLYEHEGSYATDWARRVAPGAEVGLSGPGGGDFPPGDWILMGGDETALPAIRRILAQSGEGRCGHVFLETGDPGDRVPLEVPPGITVTWLARGEGPDLLEAMSAVALPPAGESRYVWLAAERRLVRRAKAHFRDTQGLAGAEGYFSAYWSAPA